MNELSVLEVTMTSLELVEFIKIHEKRNDLTHANFLAKVPKVLGEGVIRLKDTYTNPQNRQIYPIYRFPKREACLMAMSYSYELQAKVYDKMTELEAERASKLPAIPKTLSQALRLAADQAETIEKQALLIEQQKPAVDFVDRYVNSDGLKGFREVAKLLKIKETEFTHFLIEKNIMYRLGGKLTAYQKHIAAGRFVVKAGANESGYAFTETKFTPKGVEFVANLIGA